MNRTLERVLESVNAHAHEQERRSVIEYPRTLGAMYAEHLTLPGLVAFWPMSSVQRSTGNAYDISGQGRTLTYNGNPTYNLYASLIPYLDLDGTGDYLERADETDLDILGTESIYAVAQRGLTLGGWFWFDDAGVDEGVFNKIGGAGQRSYGLQKLAADQVRMAVSGDGTALIDANATITTGAWYHIVGRYDPSTEVAIWANGVKTVDTASIPASLFNSTAALDIGRLADGTQPMDGRAALCWLCANVVPDDRIQRLFKLGRIFFGV